MARLFGTTDTGGIADGGVVFQLTSRADPSRPWTEKVLHRFSGQQQGGYPLGLVLSATGDLFGVTLDGGARGGSGTVFRLAQPDPSAPWTFTQLHSFTGGDDGASPAGGLIIDRRSGLTGTTDQGGAGAGQTGNGIAFRLVPPAPGASRWTESVLHRFGGSPDGAIPQSPLLAKGERQRFGVTTQGGTGICSNTGCGTAFELIARPGWLERDRNLQLRRRRRWLIPVGNLVRDRSGRLYGATASGGLPGPGGNYETGTVFRLDPPAAAGASWTKEILYHFQGGTDGYLPLNGVLLGGKGALYGTTYEGGTGRGTLFKLTAGQPGQEWTKTILHNFVGGSGDGALPTSALVADGTGALYGTTYQGGSDDYGTVFRLVP